MLNLYQMVDPNFMSHLKEVGGQLFIRDISDHDGLVMVVGVMTKPKDLPTEHMYFVKAQFDATTGKDKSKEARGQSLTGMLRNPIWGMIEDE